MRALSRFVVKRWRLVLIVTAIVTLVSAGLILLVPVNFSLSDYLPQNTPSMKAMALAGEALPNMQVALKADSFGEALSLKEELKKLPGVEQVLWLDDSTDISGIPPDWVDGKLKDAFYKGGMAQFQMLVTSRKEGQVLTSLQKAYPDALIAGQAADLARTQTTVMGQVASIMIYALVVVAIILLIFTKHWFEPVLFFIVIGVAIIVNEGTNVFLGSVSFVTRGCAALLQLAVSIDYAVFLLHAYEERRDNGEAAPDAMRHAIRNSALSVSSSALTTAVGFMALLFMRFGLGSDMGLALVKGVIISYLSVMIVLPALAMVFDKQITGSGHRTLLPRFRRTAKLIMRLMVPILILAVIVLPPAYMAQSRNKFLYGSSGMHGEHSEARDHQRRIEAIFGNAQPQLLMVPEGNMQALDKLSKQIKALPETQSVISYPLTVGATIPGFMVPEDKITSLRAGGFDKIIVMAGIPQEGDKAFNYINRLQTLISDNYPTGGHVLSEAAVNLDLRDIIVKDAMPVFLIGLVGIGLVVLIAFRNLAIPFILLLVIQGAIWVNMATPYVMGNTINYVAYQIVSSLQLGATIDYGILLTQQYLKARETTDKKLAARTAIEQTAPSLLAPSLILAVAGMLLFILVRQNQIISEMGLIIGRGAALSVGMVMTLLPALLVVFDTPIRKLSFKKTPKDRKDTP